MRNSRQQTYISCSLFNAVCYGFTLQLVVDLIVSSLNLSVRFVVVPPEAYGSGAVDASRHQLSKAARSLSVPRLR